ncbi:pyruvate kinase [Nanoarchaeota archaeon]
MKKVKIVATIGPASDSPKMLRDLVKAGMNCVRLNTAYRDNKYYSSIIQRVRQFSEIPIMLDIKGTDIRFKTDQDLTLKRGDTLRVGFRKGKAYFNKHFYNDLHIGDIIFFKGGLYKSKVTHKAHHSITLQFLTSAKLLNGTGVNVLKDLTLKPLLSKKDKEVLKLAKKQNVEYIALSFTKSKHDILEVKRHLNDDSIGIIAKIESGQGVRNVSEILDVADGIMVARGDLGVETPKERIPLLQKQLIKEANQRGKIVITATEMLQSMVEQPIPTRAETTDVANAILDGTDSIMLSAETALGKYPILAVKEMSSIAKETEPYVKSKVKISDDEISEVITNSVSHFCSILDMSKIITITRSGFTARMISRFKNNEEIIAITRDNKSKRKMELIYGVTPIHFKKMPRTDQVVACAKFCHKKGLLRKQDTVLFTAGTITKKHGTNTITIIKIKDVIK